MKFNPDDWPEMEDGGCMGEGCSFGRACPCWEEGEQEGSFNTTDEAVSEALSTARCEVERVINTILVPLEDKLILRGEGLQKWDLEATQKEVSHLSDLKRRILEALG